MFMQRVQCSMLNIFNTEPHAGVHTAHTYQCFMMIRRIYSNYGFVAFSTKRCFTSYFNRQQSTTSYLVPYYIPFQAISRCSNFVAFFFLSFCSLLLFNFTSSHRRPNTLLFGRKQQQKENFYGLNINV